MILWQCLQTERDILDARHGSIAFGQLYGFEPAVLMHFAMAEIFAEHSAATMDYA